MSINRYNAKTDSTQAAIVRGLEQAGVRVWVIKQPCDLLCWFRGIWQPLEVKTPYGKKQPKPRTDKRQVAQAMFLRETRTPVVTSLSEALVALNVTTFAPCTSKLTSAPSASVAGR